MQPLVTVRHVLCRFCKKDKTLIDAHVIPRCLHEPLLDPSGPMMIINTDANSYPKRTHTGQYDREILCADCDGQFSPWERYTAALLMVSDAYERYKATRPNDNFYRIEEFDYSSLKLCFLSILWKMSVSTLTSFKDIRLGPFEGSIRQMLHDKNPGSVDAFPILLFRIIDELGSTTLRGTVFRKDDGVNIYELGLPGYAVFIKVDKRPTPQPIGPRVLALGKPLIIGLMHSNLSLAAIKSGFMDKSPSRK